jgi:hypothetical protein
VHGRKAMGGLLPMAIQLWQELCSKLKSLITNA